MPSDLVFLRLAPDEFQAITAGRQRALLVPTPTADELARTRRVCLREWRGAPGPEFRAPGETGRELRACVTHVRREVASTWRGGPVGLSLVSVSTEHQARRVARLRRSVRDLQEALARLKSGRSTVSDADAQRRLVVLDEVARRIAHNSMQKTGAEDRSEEG
jgi:hypothetical protein